MSIRRALIISNEGKRLGGWILLALVVVSGVTLAEGSRGERRHKYPGARHSQSGPGRVNERQREQQHHPPAFYRRLRDLPPEQQERVLANDERFRNLPAEQQNEIREHLRHWNSLSSEEQERIRVRQEIFENLSPAQRQDARAIFQEWRQLDPARRHELRDTFIRMRHIPPAERRQFLSSQEIIQRFSSEERGLLERLTRLLPDARGQAPTAPPD